MADNQANEVNTGAKLKELRLSKGITVEELVLRANQGVTNPKEILAAAYVYKLEAGEIKSPGHDKLSLYCKGLGMSVGEVDNYIKGVTIVSTPRTQPTMTELAKQLLVMDNLFGTVNYRAFIRFPYKISIRRNT